APRSSRRAACPCGSCGEASSSGLLRAGLEVVAELEVAALDRGEQLAGFGDALGGHPEAGAAQRRRKQGIGLHELGVRDQRGDAGALQAGLQQVDFDIGEIPVDDHPITLIGVDAHLRYDGSILSSFFSSAGHSSRPKRRRTPGRYSLLVAATRSFGGIESSVLHESAITWSWQARSRR